MKAILEFDLNDPDDRMAHLRAVKSVDMSLVLFDMTTKAYKKLEDDGESAYNQGIIETLEYLRDRMDYYGVNLDELIS
jgi:hypothetical protein